MWTAKLVNGNRYVLNVPSITEGKKFYKFFKDEPQEVSNAVKEILEKEAVEMGTQTVGGKSESIVINKFVFEPFEKDSEDKPKKVVVANPKVSK